MAQFFDQRVAQPLVARLPSWVRANHLSVARAALVVPVILWRDHPALALGVLALSSLCDLFDGPLARLRGQTSQFGAVLDATCDKVFILGALLFACGDRVALGLRVAIVALDVALTVMRPIKRCLGATASSNFWGAVKMWIQSIALGLVLSRLDWAEQLAPIAFILAVGFAVLSLVRHLQDCFRRDLASG